MTLSVLIVSMGLGLLAAFVMGRQRSLVLAERKVLASLPHYYGMMTLIWAAVPGIVLFSLWIMFEDRAIEYVLMQSLPIDIREDTSGQISLILNQIYNIAFTEHPTAAPDFMQEAAHRLIEIEALNARLRFGMILSLMLLGGVSAFFIIRPNVKALESVEAWFKGVLLLCCSLSVLATIGIVVSVIAESWSFFVEVSIFEFLFGLDWHPKDYIDPSSPDAASFGAVPLFLGTLSIAGIAMVVAIPTGMMAGIYLSEYASHPARSVLKPLLEVLAGVPTIVYGFIAALTVAPLIRDIALWLGLDQWMIVSSESVLAAGLVIGFMIIPLISSLTDDAISAVPQGLRDSALALGATSSETILWVVIPSALPSIVAGIMLAAARAIGETMIVVMAAGLAANLTLNPLDSMTTITVQIVNLLAGDQEFDSPKTLAAFALGFMLFMATFILNYLALFVVRRYRGRHA